MLAVGALSGALVDRIEPFRVEDRRSQFLFTAFGKASSSEVPVYALSMAVAVAYHRLSCLPGVLTAWTREPTIASLEILIFLIWRRINGVRLGRVLSAATRAGA
jgi:hypothetical protein